MSRPMLTREARERCAARNHGTIYGPLDAQPWCASCGAIFIGDDIEYDTASPDGSTAFLSQPCDIDWPATEAADRADIETMGQGVLDLD